jgi:hypothetical protein
MAENDDSLEEIKKMLGGKKSDINYNTNTGYLGLNMDSNLTQVRPGQYTYALNASLENFDATSFTIQNEAGNEFCLNFPQDYQLIGKYYISEVTKHIFFLANPLTNQSEIGYMDHNDCQYHTLVNDPCLNFNIKYPIHKVVHRKTNCKLEIYWTDAFNVRRYMDILDPPYKLKSNSSVCTPEFTKELDCNQLKLQPTFSIPQLLVNSVRVGGSLTAGTYQFAIQYSDASGNPYTSFYSITNPTPIADINLTTVDFNYPVGKSIILNVIDLDTTGQWEYFNIAVIKTINAITSVDLVGTYFIERDTKEIAYTGQEQSPINLSINDIFEKFPYYDIAEDLTTAQDVLIWKGLTSIDQLNFQSIASQIHLQWETYRIPATENYSNELNATNFRGYLRDEIYAFEICFLLRNGKQTEGFHIPGRKINNYETSQPIIFNTNPDYIGNGDPMPYWKIYNTAYIVGTSNDFTSDVNYKGPYQYGEFAYWESTDQYPCNETLWGVLSGQPIRHHKFPDVLISPIFESKVFSSIDGLEMGNTAIFPIGVRIDSDIESLIHKSSLTQDQKDNIVGYKILRGDRGTNKSIVAKGILRNIGEYQRNNKNYYYANYPYNDISDDVFLNSSNNAYSEQCETFTIRITSSGDATIDYIDCNTNKQASILYSQIAGPTVIRSYPDAIGFLNVDEEVKQFCCIGFPTIKSPATGDVEYATYDIWRIGSVPSFLDSLTGGCAGWTADWVDAKNVAHSTFVDGSPFNDDYKTKVKHNTLVSCSNYCDHCGIVHTYESTVSATKDCSLKNTPLSQSTNANLRYRQIFNSPETSFGSPFLGNILKIENAIFGRGVAHFQSVKNNANYKLLTAEAQQDALKSSEDIAAKAGTDKFDAGIMFTTYQSYLQIYINGITKKNFAQAFHSIADYNYSAPVPNGLGIKQRMLDISLYLNAGSQSVSDVQPINNYQRETSVYLRTIGSNGTVTALPYPKDSVNVLSLGMTDISRFTISEKNNCGKGEKEENIQVLSYYASLKNEFLNQWGQIYSYVTIDTGFQVFFGSSVKSTIIFGGDTFISRFGFKTKLPFFLNNTVNAPDDTEIFYDEIGNIGYPKYWHTARSILQDYSGPNSGNLTSIISYKDHNFDCANHPVVGGGTSSSFYDGYFYMFAYGVPYFYCESSYNIDLRQAFNNKEGDFYPHVATYIPDDWFQEANVSIQNDNTYYYNTTFSKQNKENNFTHLPPDWTPDKCFTVFPFRAIYSDLQNTDANVKVNNWLI